MSEHDILMAIGRSWLGHVSRDVKWVFPTFETIHFFGLCMLYGALLVVDLRLMGMLREIPLQRAMMFTRLAIAGFVLNILSGIGFFAADPLMYWPNPAFRLKMALVVLAGINVIWFEAWLRPKLMSLPGDADTNRRTKVAGGLSLGLWTVILILGRLLPQFETY